MSQLSLVDKTTVITGAANGIGRAIAISLAKRHCHLALADINEAGLAETATLIQPHNVRISCHKLDVSEPGAVATFPKTVLSAHPGVDILVNNAGVALEGTFTQVSAADFDWLFNINFHGVVWMTRAFLPLLQQSREARLVNISSIFGLIAPPKQVAYAASKFAVRGFSEALRHELRGTNVGVTVVHPGGVATAIAQNARRSHSVSEAEREAESKRYQKMLSLPPEVAAETIVTGIQKRQNRVLVGSDAKAIALIARLLPVSYWRLIERLI